MPKGSSLCNCRYAFWNVWFIVFCWKKFNKLKFTISQVNHFHSFSACKNSLELWQIKLAGPVGKKHVWLPLPIYLDGQPSMFNFDPAMVQGIDLVLGWASRCWSNIVIFSLLLPYVGTFCGLLAAPLANNTVFAGLINCRTVLEEGTRGGRRLEGEPLAVFCWLAGVKTLLFCESSLKVIRATCAFYKNLVLNYWKTSLGFQSLKWRQDFLEWKIWAILEFPAPMSESY